MKSTLILLHLLVVTHCMTDRISTVGTANSVPISLSGFDFSALYGSLYSTVNVRGHLCVFMYLCMYIHVCLFFSFPYPFTSSCLRTILRSSRLSIIGCFRYSHNLIKRFARTTFSYFCIQCTENLFS